MNYNDFYYVRTTAKMTNYHYVTRWDIARLFRFQDMCENSLIIIDKKLLFAIIFFFFFQLEIRPQMNHFHHSQQKHVLLPR